MPIALSARLVQIEGFDCPFEAEACTLQIPSSLGLIKGACLLGRLSQSVITAQVP